MPESRIFSVANMSFNAIHKNKFLTKISEFTVDKLKICFCSCLCSASVKYSDPVRNLCFSESSNLFLLLGCESCHKNGQILMRFGEQKYLHLWNGDV